MSIYMYVYIHIYIDTYRPDVDQMSTGMPWLHLHTDIQICILYNYMHIMQTSATLIQTYSTNHKIHCGFAIKWMIHMQFLCLSECVVLSYKLMLFANIRPPGKNSQNRVRAIEREKDRERAKEKERERERERERARKRERERLFSWHGHLFVVATLIRQTLARIQFLR